MCSLLYENTPILSVAIPTYNRINYLQECLNCLISQIEEFNNLNVEIVISDNGSTDDTEKVVSEYLRKYRFIRYVRFDTNQGFDINVRSCVDNSAGKYIHILSDDDLVSKNYLYEIMKVLSKDPDFVALSSKAFKLDIDDINETDGQGFNFINNINLEFNKENLINFIDVVSYWFTFVSAFIFKREIAMLVNEQFLTKTYGSWFAHIPYYFSCLKFGSKFIFASNKVFINGRVNNFAHYNFYDVFLNKFKKTLTDCCRYFNLPKKIVRICYSKMLKYHTHSFEYRIRIGEITTFKTKPKFRYVLKTLSYYNSWRYFVPVAICPKWILRKHYYRRNK